MWQIIETAGPLFFRNTKLWDDNRFNALFPDSIESVIIDPHRSSYRIWKEDLSSVSVYIQFSDALNDEIRFQEAIKTFTMSKWQLKLCNQRAKLLNNPVTK